MENLRWINAVVIISCILAQVPHSSGDPENDARLFHDLKQSLDPDIIPLPQDGTPLKVTFTMRPTYITDVDKENNQVEVTGMWYMEWITPRTWDPAEYGNITSVHLPASSVWTPDLMVFNSVRKPEILSPEIVLLANNGHVLYMRAVRLRFLCYLSEVDSSSGSVCTMKVISWTYNGQQLTLSGLTDDTGENFFFLDEYSLNPQYSLLNATSQKNVSYYTCCPEPYEDVQLTMTIRENGQSSFSSTLEWV